MGVVCDNKGRASAKKNGRKRHTHPKEREIGREKGREVVIQRSKVEALGVGGRTIYSYFLLTWPLLVDGVPLAISHAPRRPITQYCTGFLLVYLLTSILILGAWIRLLALHWGAFPSTRGRRKTTTARHHAARAIWRYESSYAQHTRVLTYS